MRRLKESIETGETLRIIYHGGSQPGTVREIVPQSIKGEKLRAFCIGSGASKTFIISKIEIVEDNNKQEVEYNSEIARQQINPVQHYKSIDDLLKDKREFLESLGWQVKNNTEKYQIADSREQYCEYLSLYSHFKNGKIRKTPDIVLSFEALTSDGINIIFSSDSINAEEVIKERVRPWGIRAKKEQTKTYGSLDKASEQFLEWANLYKPS